MSYTQRRSSDFMLDVQRGLVSGHTTFTVLGKSAELTTASIPEDVWMGGNIYNGFTTSANTIDVQSDNASDATGSTGAEKVVIVGLDNNLLEITEEVVLSGTNTVTTTQQFKRVNQFYVSQAGSNRVNVGNITCNQTGSPSVIFSHIDADYGYAMSAIWTVPSDETWYMYGVDASMYDTGSNRAVVEFGSFDSGVMYRYYEFAVSSDAGISPVDVSDRFVMPSGSDWFMQVVALANNGAKVTFNGIFLKVKN